MAEADRREREAAFEAEQRIAELEAELINVKSERDRLLGWKESVEKTLNKADV